MFDSIGALSGDTAIQVVAGLTGAASLAAFGLAHLAGPPRPCWTRNRCMIKQENKDACLTCTVYLRNRDADLQLRQLPEIGEVRRLTVIGAVDS
jgi:hypothetical protein